MAEGVDRGVEDDDETVDGLSRLEEVEMDVEGGLDILIEKGVILVGGRWPGWSTEWFAIYFHLKKLINSK